jgi:hypothetical protein
VWRALSGGLGETELANLAILLLEIVCNTAGTERLFSNLKIRLSDRKSRMKLPKLEKKAKGLFGNLGRALDSMILFCFSAALATFL